METPAAATYQFGPFELNAASGELLRDGRRVKIQDQPFRLLVVLVENSGQVVAREEIQSRIWDSNTFVDFESSLRVAVRKLRDALGDDAENPQYIETIPKRGYRLLVPAFRPTSSLQHSEREIRSGLPASSLEGNPKEIKVRAKSHWDKWIIALAILVILTAAVTRPFFVRAQPKLTPADAVVLADFENSTGDPVFDGTLRQGMAVQLEQSPYLSLVSDERIQHTLRLMDKPADARLTPQIAHEICERTGSAAVLDGSIATLGSQYVLGLKATHCRTGETLDQEQARAAKKEEVLSALDQIARRFRGRVGESLTTVVAHDTPLAEATTPSLEALKAYSTGWQVTFSQSEAASIPFFKRAIEADPQFAVAYAALGLMYGTTGETGLAAEYTRKAYDLRSRASDAERFFITAYYDGRTTGNEEKAQQTCEAWAQTYPRDWTPHSFLTGFVYPVLGNYEKAAEEGERLLNLQSEFAYGYVLLSDNYLRLERLDKAERLLQRAAERGLDAPFSILERYDLAFLKNDTAGMQRAEDLAEKNPEAEDWVTDHEGFVLAYTGQLREARRMSSRAAELAQQASHTERAALFQTSTAIWEGLSGNRPAAVRGATAVLKVARNREIQYGAGLAFALAGDTSRSAELATDLERQYPEDTSVRFNYLPTLRALIAINGGEPSKAIEFLQTSVPYDLGTPRSKLAGFFGALYPIYVRGQAYLLAGQGNKAAVEFQKILDHRGIVVSDPIGALAHLQLGRAYALSGDKARAKAAYEDFLALWTKADPEIPVLKQAKAEFTTIH